MIDQDRVIREAAVKNRLVVRKDDEVMILATIINHMLDDLEVSLAAALEKSGREHNELARRWRLDAEAGAERVLNAALGAGREAASRVMTEGADKVTALISATPAEAARNGLFMEKEAINFAVREIVRDNPDLYEAFRDVSPGLKYDHLQGEFEAEFREGVGGRLAMAEREYMHRTGLVVEHCAKGPGDSASMNEWEERREALEKDAGTARDKFLKFEKYAESKDLVDADVALAAEKRVRELFPEIVEQRDFEQELSFEARLKEDPEELYADVMEELAFRHLGSLGEELEAAEAAVENARRDLAEHDEDPPGTLRNIVSLGAARKAWSEKRQELAGEIDRRVDAVAKIEALREDARDGCVNEDTRGWVTDRIALEHPGLVAACAERERMDWEKINQARLDAHEAGRNGRGGGEELSAGMER